jgi:hypothetical protein
MIVRSVLVQVHVFLDCHCQTLAISAAAIPTLIAVASFLGVSSLPLE